MNTNECKIYVKFIKINEYWRNIIKYIVVKECKIIVEIS